MLMLMMTPMMTTMFLELTRRDVPGFAIGGLSGGEEKGQFWQMVTLSTDHLPRQKPRYLMGVGFVLSAVIYSECSSSLA